VPRDTKALWGKDAGHCASLTSAPDNAAMKDGRMEEAGMGRKH